MTRQPNDGTGKAPDVDDNMPVMSFWEHLDVLRGSLIRILVATVLMAVVAFLLKEPLFRVVLAPSRAGFFVYKWMGAPDFSLQLINTGLTEQFMVHLKVAFLAGLLVASPYVLFLLFRFISPALYEQERRGSLRLTLAAYVLFLTGLVACYVLVFPLTVRFLGTYQVSDDVDNLLSISSYVDTFVMMSLTMGVVFEIPVLSWLLARMGMLRAAWMRKFRRHAVVVILVVAAIVTPTADAFTLVVVSLPIWLLYEASIGLVGWVEKGAEAAPSPADGIQND